MIKLDRRAVLRGAGGFAIALPWLEAMDMPRARAAGLSTSGFPKRFIVWYIPTGYIRETWTPTGSETSFTLGRSLKPLEPYKNDLVVLDGLDNTASNSKDAKGDLHSRGMASMLSGIESIIGDPKEGCCGGESKSSGGITIDQEIVKQTMPKTKFSSLELSIFKEGAGGHSNANYLGPFKPLPTENSPQKAFARVFGGGVSGGALGDPMALARLQAERRSVLDAAGKTYQGLSPKLGKTDQDKLDAHLTQVRDLEKRLSFTPTSVAAGSCPKPVAPASATDMQVVGKAQIDIMATALACDQTRVGTLQWSNSVSGARYPWLGLARGHHDMSHDAGQPAVAEQLTVINTWHNEQLAYLAGKLKAVPEGTGTLLDNTLIMTISCLGRGEQHGRSAYPYTLLGHAGGGIKTGRFLKFPSKTNNANSNQNLYVSILRAFDIPATTFGNPVSCAGPLAGL